MVLCHINVEKYIQGLFSLPTHESDLESDLLILNILQFSGGL